MGIIIFPCFLTEFCTAWNNTGSRGTGRSDHHRFQGGGIAVPNSSVIPIACSQDSSRFLSLQFQSLFRVCRSYLGSPPLVIAPLNGSPSGNEEESASSILKSNSNFSGMSILEANSLAHQSRLYPEGTRFLLFSRNSPKPMSISPASQIWWI